MKLIGVMPAGRRQYLSVLVPYILRERSLFSEFQLWANTTNADDLRYLEELAHLHRPLFRVIAPTVPMRGLSSIVHFYQHAQERGTVYLKLDDDICWIATGGLATLLEFRVQNPDPVVVYANTINSPMCSHIHQRLGCVPLAAGIATYDPHCNVGWKSGPFAEAAHRALLAAIQDGTTSRFTFDRWVLWAFERVSINACMWRGDDMVVPEIGDDEHWIAVDLPRRSNRPNAICGAAMVSHFAFHTQRPYLEQTDLLNAYGELSHAVLGNRPSA